MKKKIHTLLYVSFLDIKTKPQYFHLLRHMTVLSLSYEKFMSQVVRKKSFGNETHTETL